MVAVATVVAASLQLKPPTIPTLCDRKSSAASEPKSALHPSSAMKSRWLEPCFSIASFTPMRNCFPNSAKSPLSGMDIPIVSARDGFGARIRQAEISNRVAVKRDPRFRTHRPFIAKAKLRSLVNHVEDMKFARPPCNIVASYLVDKVLAKEQLVGLLL